ncbi:MAG: S26 family signal peptidase [Chlamydiales bacterium]|nr:S26 family signal peptidase [Chlamydiales bacterium]
MNYIFKGLFGLFLGFSVISWAKDHVCVLYSETDSLPYHYFLELKQFTPNKGHYSIFNSPWYGGKVIKEIAGVSGDSLKYDETGKLWVGGELVGCPKNKSSDDRILTPIEPGVIPKGFVFLKGDHERSFDSRYAEMGLIHVKNLQGLLIGVW